MPLASFKSVPVTVADWDRFFRAVIVEADTALTAINAQNADTATLAATATNAVNAAQAALADLATLATSAVSADDASLLEGQPGSYYNDAANLTGTIDDARIPAAIARDAEVTAAISTHEGLADPHTVYPLAAGTEIIAGAWSFALPPRVPTHAVAALPSAATYARGLIYVSDETGGATIAFSDGTNWRRVQDRAVVS